jgi:hypothetical protein
MKDPIVEEVREARRKHAKRFNFDLHAICVDLKKKEKECGYPIKSLPPKILQTTAANDQNERI